MKICIPVTEDKGLESPVCAHFGSAPMFLFVDTETKECETVANANQHHAHGMCRPLAALAGRAVDGIVVGGIGRGALMKLMHGGVDVFLAEQPTVGETVAAYVAGSLRRVALEGACGGHGHGGGCGGH